MRHLVALDLAAGPTFVAAMRRCFDEGDAVFPVDQRLSGPAKHRLFAALQPHEVVDAHGTVTALQGGESMESDDALVMATSGTTGDPKGAVLSHRALAASAEASNKRLDVDPLNDCWICCIPVSHIGGLSVITRALHSGTSLEILRRFDPEAVRSLALQKDATLISLVATALGRLDKETISKFRTILLGGSAPPVSLPENVVTTYGMTETGSGVVYDGLALDGVELAIDESSQIRVRGEMLLRSYRDGFDPKDDRGYFATGDAGAFDSDGRLVVFGRTSELIISGGENVWPIAVERVLGLHPGVNEAAVAGVVDEEWGEKVVGYVVPRDLTRPPSPEELHAFVRSQLGPIATPKTIEYRSALPRTSNGKVLRSALRDQANRG